MDNNSPENHEMAPADTYFRNVRAGGGVLLIAVGVFDVIRATKSGVHIHNDTLVIKNGVETGAKEVIGASVAYMGYGLIKASGLFTRRRGEEQDAELP